jgi:hypothetical protein
MFEPAKNVKSEPLGLLAWYSNPSRRARYEMDVLNGIHTTFYTVCTVDMGKCNLGMDICGGRGPRDPPGLSIRRVQHDECYLPFGNKLGYFKEYHSQPMSKFGRTTGDVVCNKPPRLCISCLGQKKESLTVVKR